MPYFVYVIELDKEVLKHKKFRDRNLVFMLVNQHTFQRFDFHNIKMVINLIALLKDMD